MAAGRLTLPRDGRDDGSCSLTARQSNRLTLFVDAPRRRPRRRVFRKLRRELPPPAEPGGATEIAPKIVFQAYADDYTVSGEIELAAGRLHELLQQVEDLAIEKVHLRALEDGRQHDL